jgi:hypothetical protein
MKQWERPFYCQKCGWKVTSCGVRTKTQHRGRCCGCLMGLYTEPDLVGLSRKTGGA